MGKIDFNAYNEPNGRNKKTSCLFSSYGMGEFDLYHSSIRTLDFHPEFIPRTSVKGLTWNSISIGWTQPNEEKQVEYIDYYKLTKKTTDNEVLLS